ncbi:type II secretion system protein F [Chromobacterium amazonense]|uniref:Type II secretion system protein F n=2 Tax=Chromobacterium amazonense TaxID=1382803 RepID=A0A2S9X5K3_9NEIS|nr:type II secretion system protein F [Chromobacterium amazonense]
MGKKTRMRIYEKLGRFIGNGLPMAQAVAELHRHASRDGKKPNLPEALALAHWRRMILNGQPLSRALQGWAPQREISVLAAGEIAGRFDRAVQDVQFINQASTRINSALAGLIYPVFLLFSTCLYLYIFGAQVVPAFDAILPKEQWQGAGKTMAALADFVGYGLLPSLMAVSLIAGAIVVTLNVWTGRVRQWLDFIPPWSFYRLVMGANFLISISALLHAGVSVPDALRIIAKQAGPWYRERLLAIRGQILNGARNLGDAMHRCGYQFPSEEIVMDVRAYAQLDGFENMLDKLARQWLDETVVLLNNQMAILRNLAILLMGLVFMWIAAGMFDLQQQISSSASS